MTACALCNKENVKVNELGELNQYYEIICKTCGHFIISDQAKEELSSTKYQNDKHKISAFVTKRNLLNEKITIIEKTPSSVENITYQPFLTIHDIIDQFPITMENKINQALINLTLKTEYPGYSIGISKNDFPLLLSTTAQYEEISFILQSLEDKGYIFGNTSTLPTGIIVSAQGWNKVNEINNGFSGESKQGFIAMSFDKSMDSASDAIINAIQNTGYEPMRIDNKHHNNRIDSEIIAEIRRSKFVVADVTQHRNGVYYEAGFAQGLSIPVIWTCNKMDFDGLHFDTRQLNHIIWEDEEELSRELYNRIRATIV